MTQSLRHSIRKWKSYKATKSEVKSTKDTTSSNLPTKEIRPESEESMNGGTCSGSRIHCVHARVATCACFPFLLIGFRESTAAVKYTLHHGISQRRVSPSCPLPTQAHPLSLHLHRLYRAPRGRALIYLKDEVDAKLPASSLPARVARFFVSRIFTSIFILDFCPYSRANLCF